MKTIISRLFKEHDYRLIWNNSDVFMYTNANDLVASFILVKYIDITLFEDNESKVRTALKSLEEEYVGNDDSDFSIRTEAARALNNGELSAAIDKNTSAIYVLKVSDIQVIDKYRNLVYSIEETATYFKRYILAYDEDQVNELKQEILASKEITLQSILTNLSNNTDDYNSLMNGISHSKYELVIRLFAKIPILQYEFETTKNILSLDEMIMRELNDALTKYDGLLSKGIKEVKEYIDITEDESEEEINRKVDELLGVKNE